MALIEDDRISAMAKLAFGVISNLSNSRGYCFATNKYLANILKIHEMTASRYVNELLEYEYIIRFDEIVDGVMERRLRVNNSTYGGSSEKITPPNQDDLPPVINSDYHNSISNNTIIEYKKNNNTGVLNFPDEKSNEAWGRWIKYRKEIKKPVTPSTATMQLRKLGGVDEITRVKMINQSIENGWQGLYELKNKSNGKPNITAEINSIYSGLE